MINLKTILRMSKYKAMKAYRRQRCNHFGHPFDKVRPVNNFELRSEDFEINVDSEYFCKYCSREFKKVSPPEYHPNCRCITPIIDENDCWACHKQNCTCDQDTMELMDKENRENEII